MIISIPKEVKDNEYRVALPPSGVRELTKRGHTVLVETNAGGGSGFTDDEYAAVGAVIAQSAEEAWSKAQMVVKVKEPIESEYGFLREDLTLFTYLHLAAGEELTHALLKSGITGVAYETVETAEHHLPLLQPMSEVAGRMATQIAAQYLQKSEGGRGILMSGVPGVRPAHVVVIGAGSVGANAAEIAVGMGAQVTMLDINLERLRYISDVMHGRIVTVYSNEINIAEALRTADALIGAVLVAGARAPQLVTRDMLKLMPRYSVIVDVAVDQGGCVETTHATTHSDPTYYVDDVLHYGVANMPGAVPRTSSLALSNATLPYVIKLASGDLDAVMEKDPALAKGLNVRAGKVTYAAVADAFGMSMA